jgi:CRP-like cAMP-binding protein
MATGGEVLRPRFPARRPVDTGVEPVRRRRPAGTAARARVSAVVRILDEDPDLGTGLNDRRAAAARNVLVARAFVMPTGPWHHGNWGRSDHSGIGLLLLDGLLVRRVQVGGRASVELLGAGDILRPWGRLDTDTWPHSSEERWSVLRAARIAVLDSRFAGVLASFPEVSTQIGERMLLRTRRLTVQMAITAQPRVATRLVGLLWQLAERWGRVRADGVFLELPLTHSLLADLAATCRPTVTLALRDLQREGVMQKAGNGWLLSPPGPSLDGAGEARSGPDALA